MAELKGILNKKTIDFFELKDNKVYIGEQNIIHIKNKHYIDYVKYYEYLSEIINSPDYIGRNLKDNSLELVKVLFCEEEKKYIKVAIRITQKGNLFVRTLYILNSLKFEFQVSKGYYKKL